MAIEVYVQPALLSAPWRYQDDQPAARSGSTVTARLGPKPGRESLARAAIGDDGFGVVVKGESMAGRGIHDGDVVWVNPERPYALGKVVLALATRDEGGEAGLVVKTYAGTEVGKGLVSETGRGRMSVACHNFKVIGPAVAVTSWRLL